MKKTLAIPAEELARIPPDQVMRRFDYDRRLLPNQFVAGTDAESRDLTSAVGATGLSMGYPAWNLLYYSLLCSVARDSPLVVETGTNLGFSTILMAQALKDAGRSGRVLTVDIDAGAVREAEENAEKAGVRELITFAIDDSVSFLRRVRAEEERIDFAFVDGGHSEARVMAEFEILHPLLVAASGKAYFDNTSSGGVAAALRGIRERFGGNLVEFGNCSWCPPGAALWQP